MYDVIKVDYKALSRSAVEQACQLLSQRVNVAESGARIAEEKATNENRRAQALEAERDELQMQLDVLREQLFKPKTEKTSHDPGQESFLDMPVTVEADPSGTGDDEEMVTVPEHERKKRGRKGVSKELPEKVIILKARDEDRIGPDGERLVCGGYEVTTLIDLVPERIQRLVIKREKLVCPYTRDFAYVVPAMARLVAGGKASDQFMLTVALRKYEQGLPLHRQTELYNRQGAQLADNYLGECVRHIAHAFDPIAAAIREQVLQSLWVFADETTLRQLKAGDATVRTGYMCAWIGNRQVYFHYGPTRSSKEVRDVLGIPYDPDDPKRGWNNDLDPDSWEHGALIGFLICDGYGGYNPLFKANDIIRVACWVHARRTFKDYEERDKNARFIVQLINKIFHANKQITKAANKTTFATDQERWDFIATQRQLILPPLIADLDNELTLLAPLYSPDTAIGRAITYIRNRWTDLHVFLKYGFLPMENNTAERAVRPIAVGRKAWLFVGSEDGGRWAATMFSIIESCRLQKIDARTYCEHILNIIVNAPDRSAINYSKLTPAALQTTLRKK